MTTRRLILASLFALLLGPGCGGLHPVGQADGGASGHALTDCHGPCVHLQNDANHRSARGSGCQQGQTCTHGACGGCAQGQTSCNGICVDLQTDNNNCGACGNVCPHGQTCMGGVCGGGG